MKFILSIVYYKISLDAVRHTTTCVVWPQLFISPAITYITKQCDQIDEIKEGNDKNFVRLCQWATGTCISKGNDTEGNSSPQPKTSAGTNQWLRWPKIEGNGIDRIYTNSQNERNRTERNFYFFA